MQIFYFYLIFGILLVMLELISGTFYLFVIGISSILGSIIAIILPSWLIVTTTIIILSLLSCIIVRNYKNELVSKNNSIINNIGKEVEVLEINAQQIKVAYSGSYWNAKLKNKDQIGQIAVGTKLKITKFNNNELEVDNI